MSFMKTNTVDIIVDGTTYNTLEDYGFAIENTDYLGDPVVGDSGLVVVPGKNGILDMTEAVFGGPWYKYRKIKIKLGGMMDSETWDAAISSLRNLFDGKNVKLVFENDPDWYWYGRCSIKNFSHIRALGTFELCIDYADPYKHKDITLTTTATTSGATVSASVTEETVVPEVTCTASITITVDDDTTYSFVSGTHKNLEMRLSPGTHSLKVKGSGSVTIFYKDGSL